MKNFAKWIDSAISKTINIPNDYPFDKFGDVYLDAYKTGYIKGVTTYRAGTMMSVLSEATEKKTIQKTRAPKRPNAVECDVHHAIRSGERYYVVVGLIDGEPYEVFSGQNDDGESDVVIPKSIKNGKLIKKSRDKYIITNEEKEWSCLLTNGHCDVSTDAITRLISTALRHGADISFIVHQLEKTEGDLMTPAKVIARTLKKYISDGTPVHGEECPSCKSTDMIRQEGCILCKNCSWSRCG